MTGAVTLGDLRRIGTASIIMEEEALRIAGVRLPVAEKDSRIVRQSEWKVPSRN